jgi:hypothetical protein
MNRFINENIKPGENIPTLSTTQTTTNSAFSKKNKRKNVKSTDIPCEPTNSKSNPQINLNEWLTTQPSTNAIQLIRHMLTNDTRMHK